MLHAGWGSELFDAGVRADLQVSVGEKSEDTYRGGGTAIKGSSDQLHSTQISVDIIYLYSPRLTVDRREA